VAGFGTEELRGEIRDSTVQIHGKQEGLRALYTRARVFVVPTRYTAGLPYKAHEAAAYGLPMVVSPLIARQLGGTHEADYLAATADDQIAANCVRLYPDSDVWERCRRSSLARVERELGPASFQQGLHTTLNVCTLNTVKVGI